MIKKWSFIMYILISLTSIKSQQTFPDNPTANLSTTWINNVDSINFALSDHNLRAITVRPIPNPTQNLAYACGFFSIGLSVHALFSVSIVKIIDSLTPTYEYQIVWSANRNNPVDTNAIFELSPDGNMILKDAGGEVIWSTNTTGMSVKGLNLTESGNLVLFDENNNVVWQSFDHPTDSLLPEQRLKQGERLIASVSETNTSEGQYSYTHTNDGILLYVGTEVYYHNNRTSPLENVSLRQLGWDGHLRDFKLNVSLNKATDNLEDELSICGYPMVCGEYGVCQNGQCSCPQCTNSSMSYFTQAKFRQPNLGCSLITPLDCNASHLHSFVEVLQASYFTFRVEISNTDRNTCKKACLTNCSCKAAIFRYMINSSIGDCYLPFQIYSLMGIHNENSNSYSLSIYLKVQTSPNNVASRKNYVPTIIGLTFGVLVAGGIVSALIVIMIWKKMWHGEVDEDDLDCLPTVPARYSLKDLKIATLNFSMKLGEGGSGSVYQGSLKDGTKISVKYLDGIGHIDNSFLTEIRSIGNIHHVNLVSLVGYCANKSRRLLVYEYMANGSLDKWLDNGRQKFPLDWNKRKNIVIGIAKGLAYLHEDCRQKIVHLDVKPGNIQLDDNFNAKLSDFGLSKVLSRGQSKIVTTLRGTPRYLAPEWLSSVITEKVDVYGFGVVIIEIICGRKVFDVSQQHEDQIDLLSIFSRKAKEMKLLDLVDEFCNDAQSNGREVMKMMQVAAWCLQNEFSVRPSMSSVVKVLEGIIDVDLTHLDYNFASPIIFEASRLEGHYVDVSPIFSSILSGPR